MRLFKIQTIFLIITLTLSTLVSANEFHRDPIVTSTSASWTDSRAFSSLSDCVTAIGTNEQTILINQTESVTADLTIPSNIKLHFTSSGTASISAGKTLTINSPGHIIAGPLQQIFSGSGTVAFTNPGGTGMSANNWGENTTPGITDMTDELQAAITACGNKCPIIVHDLLRISDEIILPAGGGTLKGNVAHSYYVNSGRHRFHIKNLIGADDTKTLLKSTATGASSKSTWTIEDLNIDMNGSTSTGIQNADDSDGSVRFSIIRVHLHDCGYKGIVINSGGNATEIEHTYVSGPAGFIDAGEFDTDFSNLDSPYISGSVAFYFDDCSDAKILNSEAKGGFEYGLILTGTNCVVANNFFDQNHYGAYISSGGINRLTGNRFNYNIHAGLKMESSGYHIVVGNSFSYNNSSRLATTGTYDGVGILLTNDESSSINGNLFRGLDYGIEIVDASGTTIVGNSFSDIDSDEYDYSANVGTANLIIDRFNGFAGIYTTRIDAQMRPTGNGLNFDSFSTFNSGLALEYSAITLDSNQTVAPTDGTYLAVTPDAAGRTLDLDYGATKYIGTILIIRNVSSTYSFKFESADILPGDTAVFVVTSATGAVPIKYTWDGKQTLTVADNGGETAASANLDPVARYIEITCSDSDGCDITLQETSAFERSKCEIINVSVKDANFADQADVLVMAGGAMALGQDDSLTLRYDGTKWIETCRSDN